MTIIEKRKLELFLLAIVYFWCNVGIHSLQAQPTLQPTVVWEMDNKSFLIDIESVIPLDDKGNGLLLGYDTEGNLVVLEANSTGGLTEISKTKIGVTFKITALQAINKEEALIAGLTGNETIIYGLLNLKNGKLKWTRLLSKERKGTINAIIPNKDGLLLAGKEKRQDQDNHDIMLVYVDNEGNEKWYKNFGSEIGTEEVLNGVADNEGGFLLAAYADDFNANEFYAWVLRLDAYGYNTWERKFGTPRSSTIAYTVCEGENGSPIFAGNMDAQIRVTQLDKNHDTFWSKNIGKTNLRYAARGVVYSKDNHCYLYGNVYNADNKVVSIYMTKLNGKKKIKPAPNDDKKEEDNQDDKKKDKNEDKKKDDDKILKDKTLKFELVRENVLQKMTLENGVYKTPNLLWDVGDTYEFYTTKPKSGHLYLFSIDDDRKTFLHYPRKGKEIVTKSEKIMIPNADSSMIIEVGGLEYLLAVYSQEPLDNLERVVSNIKKAKGPVRSGLIELLVGLGFQKNGVAYASDEMAVDLEKSTSPIIPIIVELEVEKGQEDEPKDNEGDEDKPKKDTTKSNLHILTIGLNDAGFNSPPIEFAEKDAVDFSNVMNSIDNKALFHSVSIQQLLGDAVTIEGLKQAVNEHHQQLKEGDMSMIFISMPFKKIEGNTHLLPVNFDAANIEATSMTYQQFLELLNQTGHTKIVFMDSNYADALSHSNPNLTIINSAKMGEAVFEHEDWTNSSFTVALLEAFSNYKDKVNTDGNEALTLEEIFNYIQTRVSALAKEKFKKPQTPTMTNQKLNKTFIIGL